jgi:hypothetical protein
VNLALKQQSQSNGLQPIYGTIDLKSGFSQKLENKSFLNLYTYPIRFQIIKKSDIDPAKEYHPQEGPEYWERLVQPDK